MGHVIIFFGDVRHISYDVIIIISKYLYFNTDKAGFLLVVFFWGEFFNFVELFENLFEVC